MNPEWESGGKHEPAGLALVRSSGSGLSHVLQHLPSSPHLSCSLQWGDRQSCSALCLEQHRGRGSQMLFSSALPLLLPSEAETSGRGQRPEIRLLFFIGLARSVRPLPQSPGRVWFFLLCVPSSDPCLSPPPVPSSCTAWIVFSKSGRTSREGTKTVSGTQVHGVFAGEKLARKQCLSTKSNKAGLILHFHI